MYVADGAVRQGQQTFNSTLFHHQKCDSQNVAVGTSCISSEANRPPECIGCTSIGWNWRSVNMAAIACLCECINRKISGKHVQLGGRACGKSSLIGPPWRCREAESVLRYWLLLEKDTGTIGFYSTSHCFKQFFLFEIAVNGHLNY